VPPRIPVSASCRMCVAAAMLGHLDRALRRPVTQPTCATPAAAPHRLLQVWLLSLALTLNPHANPTRRTCRSSPSGLARLMSLSVKKAVARPFLPARPVRPMRCT